VTRDVDPLSIYAGVPARKVATRFLSQADAVKHRRALGR
jgi:acetyltransferase-like isoleucine patch superfamily enzyme